MFKSANRKHLMKEMILLMAEVLIVKSQHHYLGDHRGFKIIRHIAVRFDIGSVGLSQIRSKTNPSKCIVDDSFCCSFRTPPDV